MFVGARKPRKWKLSDRWNSEEKCGGGGVCPESFSTLHLTGAQRREAAADERLHGKGSLREVERGERGETQQEITWRPAQV